VKVPTVHGEEEIKIKRGTQSGDKIRLKNKGIDNLRGLGRGDQILRIHVETPIKLTSRQEELLREFAEISGESVQPMTESFFNKMKKFISGL